MKESETKEVTIKELTKEDVDAAAKLEAKTFSMPWKASDFLEMVNADYAHYYVAVIGKRTVGILGLRDIAGEGEITNVVVDESERRKNIASLLMETALEKCDELGIKDVTLEVRISNTPAIKLYEKFGFKEEGIRPSFYEKPKEDALIMWRRT